MKAAQFKANENMAEFQKQKLQYKLTIESLTKENQRLKQQLENLMEAKQSNSDIHRAETKEDQGGHMESQKRKKSKNTQFKTPVIFTELEQQKNEDLLRQNQRLRDQLERKSNDYEKRISQLSEFLENLKQRQNLQVPLYNNLEKLSASKMVESMESILKMFQADRQAFVSKIQELLLLIASYEKKQKENQLKERKFQMQLQIAREQIVIFKRLHKAK